MFKIHTSPDYNLNINNKAIVNFSDFLTFCRQRQGFGWVLHCIKTEEAIR
jgi:hypothetical protein